MKATKLTPEISSKTSVSFRVGQPVQISCGSLAGLAGTLARQPVDGRALIKLQQGLDLEFDQSGLEPLNEG